jgi:hypothetical protein
MQSMRKPYLVTAVLLCLSGTATAQSDGADSALMADPSLSSLEPPDPSEISSPHQASTPYDLPKIFRPLLAPDSPESEDAAETTAQADQGEDEDPMPWDEFFRSMSEAVTTARRSGGGSGQLLAPEAPKPAPLLTSEGGLASRLVGAFRVRREKEQAFRDYVQEQSTEERLISRLDGLLGNTALIVVTERFENASPNTRHEAAMRWATTWAEFNDKQISRMELFSIKHGQLVAYDIVTDRHAPQSDGSSPLAMLSGRDIRIDPAAADADDSRQGTTALADDSKPGTTADADPQPEAQQEPEQDGEPPAVSAPSDP